MSTGKYDPLRRHLHQSNADELTLSLAEIEAILDAKLPPSARSQRAWWGNRRRGALQARAWLDVDYRVETIELDEQNYRDGHITFRRLGLYELRRKEGKVVWTGEMIRALRQQLGLSQVELADELGMRQQTISEWENSVYMPRRSSSKLLTFFAERAGFEYKAD